MAEPLGAGGTADVFRGVDLRLRRDVAVKVFRPGSCAVTPERFCQEAELLGRLAHPALVEVHDVGRQATHVYVVMRLVEGVTLREHILDGPLPADRVARLGTRLASALAHVHAAGVVHRDVKPSNVLVGLDDAPYLADFGISRLVDEPTRSAPGTLIGTIPYLAPEQLLGRGSGPASDIHALGLVLLEALKGEKEYPRGPLAAGTARALRAPCIPPWAPTQLASAIEAMTHAEPADRPDAAECVRLLEAAAASEGAEVAHAAASPATVAVGAGASGPAATSAASEASAARAVRRRRHRTPALALAAGLALGAGGATVPFVLGVGSAPAADRTQPPPAPLPVADLPAPPRRPPASRPHRPRRRRRRRPRVRGPRHPARSRPPPPPPPRTEPDAATKATPTAPTK
ncbi:serine/threonine-protein kinase [Yinghuangia aomiensis]